MLHDEVETVMVTLKALAAAITQVERIRDLEYSFEASGIEIALRPLRPDEETEVQRYAQVAMEDLEEGEATQAAFADFMDRMRHASLGFAIVQIGELDLRDAEYLETEEKDDNGNQVSVLKWEAIRDLAAREWTRPMLSQVFARFGELLERVELRAAKSVKFDAVDLEEEIARVERRLTELRAAKAKLESAPEESTLNRQQRLVRDVQEAQRRQHDKIRDPSTVAGAQETVEKAAEEVPVSVEEPSPESPKASPPSEGPEGASQGAQTRRSAVPEGVPPPATREDPRPSQAPQEAPETEQSDASGVREEVDSQNIPLPAGGDSFFDPADPDEALAAETRRQTLFHQQHLARQAQREKQAEQQAALGMPSAVEQARQAQDARRRAQAPQRATRLDPRVSGLREAANTADAVLDGGAGRIQSARPGAQPRPQTPAPAELHGKPVYKMPPQTLEKKRATGQPSPTEPEPEDGAPPVTINPAPGGANERFRGPGGR